MALLAKRGLGLNAAGVRRGFEVYRQVCSKCHSLELFKLEDLKLLGYSRNQVLYLAEGKRISERAGVPYLSKLQARVFNSGVVPPDLSLVARRRCGSYVKNMLLGYTHALTPALPRGYYNNSFESGVTLMPPVLANGVINYGSRAHNNLIQYALDVAEFLVWVSEPWFNLRGRLSLPAFGVFSLICGLSLILLEKSNSLAS
ncbi:MAG: cytochrome c1 [Candidatus Hodgkinia cicadicola]